MNRHLNWKPETNGFLCLGIFLGLFFLATSPAFAGGIGAGLPYEGYLQRLTDSLSGPVAFALAVIALVVAGGMLIFGGDFSTFTRSLLYVVLVCSLLLGAKQIVTTFFGAAGSAVAGYTPPQQTDRPQRLLAA